LVKRLSELPLREDYTKGPTHRESMALYLGFGFRRGIAKEALSFLLEVGTQDKGLRGDIAAMVEGVDDPDAIEFLVRHLAAGGGSNLWSDLTGIGDWEPRVLLHSSPTTDRLRSLWESSDESEKVRTKAFCLWLRTTGCKDATLLQSIELDAPFYQYALQHRLRLGDPSVASILPPLLRSKVLNGYWWVLAHRVWCAELRSLASETLAELKPKIPTDFSGGRADIFYNLAELLVKIPVLDAQALLQEHWDHLKYSPCMIHSAFRVGTPTCVTLAGQALSLCPTAVDIFHVAFRMLWSQRNPANPIMLHHLQGLEPYLDRMREREVLFMAWEVERAAGSDEAIAEGIRGHLVPRLSPEDRTRVQVADEFFLDYLDRSYRETRFGPYLGFLFEERGGQRFVFPERQLRLLDGWLSNHRTARGLRVAAECLKYIGTRRDLDLLDRYAIEADPAEIEETKADARFSVSKQTLV
jgi:hypothetical protein